jgi:hypothetical protein
MGLLRSVDYLPGIDQVEYREQYYFNKYMYRANLTMAGIRKTSYIDDFEEFKSRFSNEVNHYNTVNLDTQKEILKNFPFIKRYIKWKKEHRENKDITIRQEWDTVSVFSNDLSFLQGLRKLGTKVAIEFTKVECQSKVGVKYFMQEPKHKYRVYIKSRRISDEVLNELRRLLISTDLFPCKALRIWLETDEWTTNTPIHVPFRSPWTSQTHFIEYDNESSLSYLALLYGNLLSNRYKLEKRPEPV